MEIIYANIVRFELLIMTNISFQLMNKIIKDRGSIYFNDNTWENLTEALSELIPSKVFILTDINTKTHCLPTILKFNFLDLKPIVLTIPDGEKHKTIDTCAYLWNELSINEADRKSLLINLGGGVITDMGGFIASTFKRGIDFINIPTSLLAMVDASIGGKNGVDLGTLKNQIGVIRDPYCIIINTQFLVTLPKNQLNSGYAEMLKHGLIHSETYWNELKRFHDFNISEYNQLIWESVVIKNKIVTDDPLEKSLRKTLNYGHTLGHAIESYLLEQSDEKPLLHGEAIAVGMILSTYLSFELLNLSKKKLIEITQFFLEHFPKTKFTNKDIDEIIKLLIYDKKNRNGKVLFVLLTEFGSCKIDCEVPNNLIHKAFEFYENF